MSSIMVNEFIPLSLYIHIPWCIKKCPYCDFSSYAIAEDLPEEEYINALLDDLNHDLTLIQQKEIQTIFIGGGTPSLINPKNIETLLNEIHKKINFASDIEITMELNPGTADKRRLAGYYAAGINRLSIGIQSFNDNKLKSLGRIHHAQQAKQVITDAQEAGFNNINMDLMHGLPNQTIKEAVDDLQTAISLAPQHLSWYQLTIEENTPFAKHPPTTPDDEQLWEIQQAGNNLLEENGFKHYEISGYAKQDYQCQHNLNYWLFGDYLGIGAAAHSKITTINNKQYQIQRIEKTKDPTSYLNGNYISQKRTLTKEDIVLEFMINALRLIDGAPIKLFTERTNIPFDVIKDKIQQAQEQGFLEKSGEALKTTPLGQQFLNECLEVFVNIVESF